ncbi:MAG: hypothetical protein ACON5F_08800 [Jejuia sp.]
MVVFTTLAEKKYFNGVAALINSVLKNGTYANKIIIGYRGALPKWLPELEASKNGKSCTLKDGLLLEFVEVKNDFHMVHEKPEWFYKLTNILEPNAKEYFFFDSDIIIVNRMSFFGEWVKQGVAICEDVNYDMASNHPIRKQWIDLLKHNNMPIERIPERYYNSGFLGWKKEDASFIKNWSECSKLLINLSDNLKAFRTKDRTDMVLSANQDSLNLTAMTSSCDISTIGPEAMGFHFGLSLMVHPLGPKPWDLNFTKEFLHGKPPRMGDLRFWEYVNGNELQPYLKLTVLWKLFWIKLYKGLSRLYSK